MGAAAAYEDLDLGMRLPVVEHDLSPSFVASFLAATGNEAATGACQPGEEVDPGMATLLSTAPFRAATGGRSGDLHVSHSFEQYGLLEVGQRTRSTSYVVDKYIRKQRKYVVYETLTTDARSGHLILRCQVTLAVRF